MPFFKAGSQLIYYAHVPKCGGSSVADYIAERFGAVAFYDSAYLSVPPVRRWTRSSPQHVDAVALARLIPPAMFDHVFTIVRHPVARLVSTYHFQLEKERSIPAGLDFSEWLSELEETDDVDPFRFDNHVRPMSQIVPQGAVVFHMEHDLNALVHWFDEVTGVEDGPRRLERVNARGAHVRVSGDKVRPTSSDLDRIARLYAEDFERFGYAIDERRPEADPPYTVETRPAEAPDGMIGRLRRRIARRVS